MNLTSMKLDPKEAKEESGLAPSADNLPLYPYGLSLYLCDDTMQKLGMTTAPDAGQKFMLTAVVEVTSSGMRKTQDGIDVNADLQITDMALQPVKPPVDAKALYPNSGYTE